MSKQLAAQVAKHLIDWAHGRKSSGWKELVDVRAVHEACPVWFHDRIRPISGELVVGSLASVAAVMGMNLDIGVLVDASNTIRRTKKGDFFKNSPLGGQRLVTDEEIDSATVIIGRYSTAIDAGVDIRDGIDARFSAWVTGATKSWHLMAGRNG